MNIYLATSWRNVYQAEVLAFLRHAGHEVYDFKNPVAGNTGFSWKQISEQSIETGADLRQVLAHPIAQKGFELDYQAMQWADMCVLLLPCGNSAHLEAGWFSGQGKAVAVYCPELREPELMYKCFDSPEHKTPLFVTLEALDRHIKQRSNSDRRSGT